MSGSELLGCVDLVLSAFTDGAGLMRNALKPPKKEKHKRTTLQTLLYHTLEQAVPLIQDRYNDGFAKFQILFQTGDDIARNELLSLVMALYSDLILVLRSAFDDGNLAPLHFSRLSEFAIASRFDVLKVLDDLWQRLDMDWPLPAQGLGQARVVHSHLVSDNGLHYFPTSPIGELPPTVVSLPDQKKKSALRRIFSHKRPLPTTENTAASNETLSEKVLSAVHQNALENKQRYPHDPDSVLVPRACNQHVEQPHIAELPAPLSLHAAHGNTQPRPLVPSNHVMAPRYERSLYRPELPAGPVFHRPKMSLVTSFSAPIPCVPESDDSSSVGSRQYDAASLYSQSATAPITPMTEHSWCELPAPISPLSPYGNKPAATPSKVSAAGSRRTSSSPRTSQMFNELPGSEADSCLLGLCKTNIDDQTKLCKGAISHSSTTADSTSHLEIRMIPATSPPFDSQPHWSCKCCHFRSEPLIHIPSSSVHDVFKKRLSLSFPDEIHISTSGIAYRWSFLFRSHVRSLDPAAAAQGRYSYGCIFCRIDVPECEKTYEGVDSLMAHINAIHAGNIDAGVAEMAGCVEGRVADTRDKWDINICQFDI